MSNILQFAYNVFFLPSVKSYLGYVQWDVESQSGTMDISTDQLLYIIKQISVLYVHTMTFLRLVISYIKRTMYAPFRRPETINIHTQHPKTVNQILKFENLLPYKPTILIVTKCISTDGLTFRTLTSRWWTLAECSD